MPVAREGSSAAILDGLAVVAGGNGATELRLTTVETYDPQHNVWAEAAPLNTGKSEPSVGFVGGAIISAGVTRQVGIPATMKSST